MKWDQNLADRLYAKAQEDENGCWVWQAYLNPAGYGGIGLGTRAQGKALAHRVSYELMVAEIPDGLDLDHLCRNRACINPYHLDPVTRTVNLARGIQTDPPGSKERAARTHCRKGHEYNEENTYMHPTGYRACRACQAAYMRAHRAKKRSS